MLEHLDLTVCVMDIDEVLLRECRTRLRVLLEPWSTDRSRIMKMMIVMMMMRLMKTIMILNVIMIMGGVCVAAFLR